MTDLRGQLEGLARADLLSLNTPARGAEESMPVEVGDTIEAPPGEFDPERAALADERAQVLRDAIASLSEREQTILVLLYVKHLQGAEIGRLLGVSRVARLADPELHPAHAQGAHRELRLDGPVAPPRRLDSPPRLLAPRALAGPGGRFALGRA